MAMLLMDQGLARVGALSLPQAHFYNPTLYEVHLMKHVRKSVLLWYSPAEMYRLVTDVARYPEFLPWCDSAQVLQQHADGVTAQVGLAYLGVRNAFTTRNLHVADSSVQLQLVDGPFSALQGLWLFKPLGAKAGKPGVAQPASPQTACKVEFDLRYSFASPALQAVVSPVFDKVANTLVESFVKRAEQVYGAR
jgi:ribosome-associated toxin RatA of RatAB toxin-antitoxin module